MKTRQPLVTIMIATKDRPSELFITLTEMQKQLYPAVEVLVIDDGSAVPVEPLVREAWQDARVIRHEVSAGQCTRRNQGFDLAAGEYILQLDDDCNFIDRDDLARAVERIETDPEAGALCFYLINSPTLPKKFDNAALSPGVVASFVGAAVLFRKKAVLQTKGYRTFFTNDWEEEELALQLLHRDWRILFFPRIVAHHRLSSLNRNSPRTWMRGLRNRLWSMIIHMPLRRLFLELGWKLGVGGWDAIRLFRFRLFFRAVGEALLGIPRALQLRASLSGIALRRYDALRLHPVLSPADFTSPPAFTWKVFLVYLRRWSNRARNQSVWHNDKSDTGTSYTVAYAHEEKQKAAETTVVEK